MDSVRDGIVRVSSAVSDANVGNHLYNPIRLCIQAMNCDYENQCITYRNLRSVIFVCEKLHIELANGANTDKQGSMCVVDNTSKAICIMNIKETMDI